MPIDLCRRITVRLSPEVYARLETVAGRTERTVSDVVRHAVEGVPVRPRRQSRAHEALIRQLIRVGSNLLCAAAHKRFYVEHLVMWS